MMKKNSLYKKIISYTLLALLVTSCSDLEENSTSTDNFEEFDASPSGLAAGAYSSLLEKFVFDADGYAANWGDIGVDVLDIPTFNGASALARNNFNVSILQAEQLWQKHYGALSDINFSLNFLELLLSNAESAADEAEIKVKIAEVLFVRSVVNFNLVRLFESPVIAFTEGLPRRVEDVDLSPSNNVGGPKAMYEFIENDLLTAIEDLNDGQVGNSGIASKQAAQALLAKVYLQAAGLIKNSVVIDGFNFKRKNSSGDPATDLYNESASLLDKVIESGIYSLAENYGNLFEPSFEGANPETLFAANFQTTGDNGGSSFGDAWGAFNRPPFGAWGGRLPQFELMLSYFDGGLIDQREYAQDPDGVFLDATGAQIVDTAGNPLSDGNAPEVIANRVPNPNRGKLFDDGVNYTTGRTVLDKYPYKTSDQRFLVNFATFEVVKLNNTRDIKDVRINANTARIRPYKWRKDYGGNLNELVANQDDRSFDFPIIRYADVLLMRAEAGLFSDGGPQGVDNSLTTSLEFLNMVRRRAYLIDPNSAMQNTPVVEENLAPLNVNPILHNPIAKGSGKANLQTIKNTPGLQVDITTMEAGTKELALAAILRERRKEFCYEGHRRDDLIRNGLLEEVVTKTGTATPSIYNATPGHYAIDTNDDDVDDSFAIYSENAHQVKTALPGDNFSSINYRLPIPLSEINLNPNLKQNTGY